MRRLALGLGDAAAWLLLAAAGVTLFEVAARYLFDTPTSWAHALATTMCGVAFALGGAHAEARDEHVRIGVVHDRLPPGGRRAVGVLSALLGLFYLGGLGAGLWDQAAEAVWHFDWDGNWAPELTPGPPGWPLPAVLRVALVAGTALFLALVLVRLAALLRGRDA